MTNAQPKHDLPRLLLSHSDRCVSSPVVMTEEELIRFLRIPEITTATNQRNVIENLKRKHGLPRIHLCGKTVYLTDSVKAWLQQRVTCGQ